MTTFPTPEEVCDDLIQRDLLNAHKCSYLHGVQVCWWQGAPTLIKLIPDR